MDMVEIKKDHTILKSYIKGWYTVLVINILICSFLIIGIGNTDPLSSCTVLFVINLIIIIYIKARINDNESEIIISEQGLQLKNHDFYKWSDIENYGVFEECDGEGSYTYLRVKVQNFKEFKLPITFLDKPIPEIESLLEAFSKNSATLGAEAN